MPASVYFNVKDPAFGAQGDGVTDDRSHIQAAINTCLAAGGGTVFFQAGTCLIGKDGANPYAFAIDNVDNVRFLIKGGSDTTEFELLSFDQSGLTSPGTDVCHVIDVISASVVKFINCQFKGSVTHTGAYIHMGGTSGRSADLIWIDGCELRDAGGPPIWIDGGTSKVWILDSTIVQSGEDDTVLIAATISAGPDDAS
jgi:hypothetical protein